MIHEIHRGILFLQAYLFRTVFKLYFAASFPVPNFLTLLVIGVSWECLIWICTGLYGIGTGY